MTNTSLFNEAFSKLEKIHNTPCFEEIENIIFSRNANSQELYNEACEYLGLEVGETGHVIISDSQVLNVACITMAFAYIVDGDYEFPLFINQQRENIIISHLHDNLFAFANLQAITSIDGDLFSRFLSTLKFASGKYIIDSDALLLLIEMYLEIGDIQIAFSDYIFSIKNDRELLYDFSIDLSTLHRQTYDDKPYVALRGMVESQRLDRCSLDILNRGLGVLK